jgi:Ca-activated chloride channel family protein
VIELAHPWMLAALAVLPLIFLRARLGGPTLGWPSLELSETGWTLRRLAAWLPEALGHAGLALLIVALARPQLVNRETVVDSQGIDILLAVDTSGSMEATDMGTSANRLQVAKRVMAEFVEQRPNDRIGLVVFGEEAFTQVPLTLDHPALIDALEPVELGVAGEHATAIGLAMAVCVQRMDEVDAPSKVVILLTDGRDNASGANTPLRIAEAAAALEITFYTIGVGSPERPRGGVLGLLGRTARGGVDERTLTQVADLTGGRFFHASDADALLEIYSIIDQLEPTTAEVREFVDVEERFHVPLLIGLICLAVQVLLENTWLRRVP